MPLLPFLPPVQTSCECTGAECIEMSHIYSFQEETPLSYKPEPIDTSKVTLSADILKLSEILAKHSHEIWAQQRFADGWQYGTQRDDTRKEDPGLVSYEELPESQKQERHSIILQVLKALLALGYPIEPKSNMAEEVAEIEQEEPDPVLKLLQDSTELSVNSLLAIQKPTIALHPRTPDIYQALSEQMLQLGEPLMAYDAIAAGLKQWPDHVRLQQLLALSLARSGATGKAHSILLQLLESGHRDEETLSLLARTHTDLWREENDPEKRNLQRRLAAESYEQAYQLSGNPYPGINAATISLLMGKEDDARTLAREVQQKCLHKLKSSSETSGDRYCLLATLGEAALILQEWSEAEDWYLQAAQVGQGRYGDLSATRRNAALLIDYLEGDRGLLRKWLPISRVVVFSGHMLDQPGRAKPRFPAYLESRVYEEMRDRLEKIDARFGYASAACGSDILFLEALLERKGEIHIVLPYEKQLFIKNSVDIIPNSNWVERFERVLDRATEVTFASRRKQEEDVLYDYANRLLHGLAKLRAQQLQTELIPLAVWNGQRVGGLGGTSSAIDNWQSCGYDVETIYLDAMLQQGAD